MGNYKVGIRRPERRFRKKGTIPARMPCASIIQIAANIEERELHQRQVDFSNKLPMPDVANARHCP